MTKKLMTLLLALLTSLSAFAKDNGYLPLVREGVKWVNEKVIINNGDTTSYYYTYEIHGDDPEEYWYQEETPKLCHYYTGSNIDINNDSIISSLGLKYSGSMVACFNNWALEKVDNENRNILMHNSYGFGMFSYERLYEFNHDYPTDVPFYYYIDAQTEPKVLTVDNFTLVNPIEIEGYQCNRYAYVGDDGDTLAYLVEGIGFDSRDMGDLLTPFTRKPDPDADYQEYWGLSHVIKDGKIIYKGMRYNPALFDDPDDDYEYLPFVREGVKWVYFYDNSDDIINPDYEPGKHYFNLELKGDTVINGKTYKAMHKYSGTSINWENDTVPVYLREEDKIVYGIIPEKQKYDDCPVGNVYDFYGSFYNGQEFVLYDFADPITFWNVNYNDYLYVPAINYQTTDTISLGNKLTKRYVWTHANMKYFYQVEGVGTDAEINGYTLYPYKDISPGMSNVYFWLSHVVENGKTIYKGIHYDPALFDNPGDVNGDGEINIGDTNSVIDVIINGGGAGTGGHSRIPACDVNGDGEVNIADVNAIIELIIGN